MSRTYRKAPKTIKGIKLPDSEGAIKRKSNKGLYGHKKVLDIKRNYKYVVTTDSNDDHINSLVSYLNSNNIVPTKELVRGEIKNVFLRGLNRTKDTRIYGYKVSKKDVASFKSKHIYHSMWLEGEDESNVYFKLSLFDIEETLYKEDNLILDTVYPKRYICDCSYCLASKMHSTKTRAEDTVSYVKELEDEVHPSVFKNFNRIKY